MQLASLQWLEWLFCASDSPLLRESDAGRDFLGRLSKISSTAIGVLLRQFFSTSHIFFTKV